jgi:hypothetical protein
MRGTIFGVVALGIGLVMTPLIVDVSPPDGTADTMLSVVGPFGEIIGLTLLLAATGLFVSFYSSDF